MSLSLTHSLLHPVAITAPKIFKLCLEYQIQKDLVEDLYIPYKDFQFFSTYFSAKH